MSIQVGWFNEQRKIILWTFPPKWSLEEFHEAYDQGNRLIREVDHWTNAIIDLRNSSIPNLINSTVISRARTDPPNHDMSVILTTNKFILMMAKIFERFPETKNKFKIVSSMEDALAFCTQRQNELTNTPLPNR